MEIEFDAAKSEKNRRERGLPFDLVEQFDFDSAWIVKDDRHDYGEVRYRAVGRAGATIVAVVFTARLDAVRVISLRLASRKERLAYDRQNQKS